jgi:hypothetical protein
MSASVTMEAKSGRCGSRKSTINVCGEFYKLAGMYRCKRCMFVRARSFRVVNSLYSVVEPEYEGARGDHTTFLDSLSIQSYFLAAIDPWSTRKSSAKETVAE